MIVLQAYTFLYTHTRTHTAVKTDVSREKTPNVFYGCGGHLLEAVGSRWGMREAKAGMAMGDPDMPWLPELCLGITVSAHVHCGAVGEIGGVFMAVFPRTRLPRTCPPSMWPSRQA